VVAIGQNAGAYTSTGATVNFGADNVLIGQYAGGIDGASGTYNVGVQNVMIGKNAGRNSRGEKNVLIGFESGLATSNNGCVSLNSGSLTGNSQFSVGNASYGGTARGFRIDFSTVTGTRALTLPTVDGELLTKNQTTIVRKTSLSAAQVQALSTTAQQIIPAPGTGKIAVLKSLTIKGNTPAGSVYSTNNNLRIRYTNTTLVAALTGVLGSYFNVSNIPDLVVPDEANLPTNNDISIFTLGGNPAGGSTGFDFIAEYIIIE
jgi:hypothetical protein